MSNVAKLRFALITEDALEKLRSRSQSEFAKSNEMGEIFTAITTTVNQMLEQKLQSLNLNKLIEDKIIEMQTRNGSNTAIAPKEGHSCRSDTLLKETHSLNSIRAKEHRRVKKRRTNQSKTGGTTITELEDKSKPKLRKLISDKEPIVKPSSPPPVRARPLPMALAEPFYPAARATLIPKATPIKVPLPKSTPKASPHQVVQPIITSSTPVGGSGPQQQQQQHQHQQQQQQQQLTTDSDPEEPSILKLAAKYLQELDESRRKQRRQSSDRS